MIETIRDFILFSGRTDLYISLYLIVVGTIVGMTTGYFLRKFFPKIYEKDKTALVQSTLTLIIGVLITFLTLKLLNIWINLNI